ncbi:MAG: hypothetical protein ACBZ72_08455 [Candidatus Bathyarchaeia archaeon]|jgi:hypothetical protein
MKKLQQGNLALYTSDAATPTQRQRLQLVKNAAEKTASQLNLNFDFHQQPSRSNAICVYYECAGEEPVPVYCDEGKLGNQEEIQASISNVMFVLSFHPRHAALTQVRERLLHFRELDALVSQRDFIDLVDIEVNA